MSETLACTVPLTCWQGDRGTYHLVTLSGDMSEALTMHSRMEQLELGARRGFGSVKVVARIGDTAWKTSVFPQNKQSEWVLLVSKKVMSQEDLAEGDTVVVELELL